MAISFADKLKKAQEGKARAAEEAAKYENDIRELQDQAADEVRKTKGQAVLDELFSITGQIHKIVVEDRMANSMAPKARKASATGTGKARTPSSGPCPICQFETSPHHDARRHRFQPEGQKKPLTAEEMKQFGYTKV